MMLAMNALIHTINSSFVTTLQYYYHLWVFFRLWKRGNVSDRYFLVLRKTKRRSTDQYPVKQRSFSAAGGVTSSAASAKMLASKGTKKKVAAPISSSTLSGSKKKYFD